MLIGGAFWSGHMTLLRTRHWLDGVRPLQDWRTAELAANGTGLGESVAGRGGILVAQVVLGLVEKAVGEMVRGAVFALAVDGRSQGLADSGITRVVGQPGPGQVTFGPQHRDEVTGRVGVQLGEQFLPRGRIV